MVVTKVKQIKSVNKLSDGIKYIEDGAKTINSELINSELDFPIVSGHLIIDIESAFSEMMQLKQLANLKKELKNPLNKYLINTQILQVLKFLTKNKFGHKEYSAY